MLSFLVSGIISGILVFRGGEKITKYEVLFGVLIGITELTRFPVRFFVGAGRHPGSYHISDVQYRCHGFDRRGGRPDVPGKADKETVGAYLLVILAVGLLNM